MNLAAKTTTALVPASDCVVMARSAADEAIDALLSAYWAHTFDHEELRKELACFIIPYIVKAVSLKEIPDGVLITDEGVTYTLP